MFSSKLEASFPLSPIQQGMLYHHLSDPRSGVDVEQILCRFPEEIDPDRFHEAWRRVVARHSMLRASCTWRDQGEPTQTVHASIDLPFGGEDWTGQPAPEQEKRLAAFLEEDRKRGFDLSAPPLLRVQLFRLGPDASACVWTVHHIACDGRSFEIVLKDVLEEYEQLASSVGASSRFDGGNDGRPPAQRLLDDRQALFREHVQGLRDRDPHADEAFWRSLLAGVQISATAGRLGRAAASQFATHGEREACLDRPVTARLREIAREGGFTLSTIVQGAWALLLERYTANEDVVFGVTLSGRPERCADVVGMFINTLPLRVQVQPDSAVLPWLARLRALQLDLRAHEATPLVDINRWCGLKSGDSLFDSLVIYDRTTLRSAIRAVGGAWEKGDYRLIERTPYPLTFRAYGEDELLLKLEYDRARFDDVAAERILGHARTLLEAIAADPSRRIADLPILTAAERQAILDEWNRTDSPFPAHRCIHQLIEEQVARTPDAVAIEFRDERLTYRELNARANRLARHLRSLGVDPGTRVGISLRRSPDMVVAVIAVHKVGAAYVPLDPTYPQARLDLLLDDAQIGALLAHGSTAQGVARPGVKMVLVDADREAIDRHESQDLDLPLDASGLAYIMYTSGSTGRPKGVMVEHRNVVSFFAGMDQRLGVEPGVWLAVTSLSFDISVLELFWTLARGFTVVLQPDDARRLSAAAATGSRAMDFSFFYFASDEGASGREKYRLLLEGAKFADENGFSAVWMPERHFHAFGGIYPNPSVTAAAVAAITQRVRIRAGSVVVPLHDPIRIAEEWAVVDNLSGGRVDISVASGWHPEDFVLQPQHFADRKEILYRDVETVKSLWRGEQITRKLADGKEARIRTLPRPVQAELPIFITTAGSPETWRRAGETGASVLTHLLGQHLKDIAANIVLYRRARKEAGHPGRGHVSLMLHTFVGENDDEVREVVRGPMKSYLRSAVSLVKNFAGQWTAYSKRTGASTAATGDEFQKLSPEDMESLLDFAFERYFETSGLFGTPEACLRRIAEAREAGVDEIACLIDFGVDPEKVLAHLTHLARVRELASQQRMAAAVEELDAEMPSIPDSIRRHKVTHFQCTPSQAQMLQEERDLEAFRGLKRWLVGGEGLPGALAGKLLGLVGGQVINMYGPTETAIWSSTQEVGAAEAAEATVPIGRPILNTRFHVLDRRLQPVPVGVPGELFIGGAGVARGYWNRQELTAERFIQHPLEAERGGRLYRTGDLVRWRADGVVEFLGRADFQVKIRGHRIELGEIESLLVSHPSVREATVLAREDVPGDKRLVAYCVARDGSTVTPDELKAHLVDKLPAFMIPGHFVVLEALPLTPNGKVDRKSLPAPEIGPAAAAVEVALPEGEIERELTAIWKDVLHLPQVGVTQNFFDLGGHSLLVVQVLSRIRSGFGKEIPIADIFRFPTIRALARHLGNEAEIAQAPALGKSVERGAARREMRLGRQRPRTGAS
jgi:natural product biosynthesis luciferase-like monooxygenase protein